MTLGQIIVVLAWVFVGLYFFVDALERSASFTPPELVLRAFFCGLAIGGSGFIVAYIISP